MPAQHHETLRQEAMDWRVRRQAGQLSPKDQAAFDAWLAQSDEHRDVYAGVDEFWAAAGQLAEHPRYGAIRSRAEAEVGSAFQTRRAIAAGIAAAVVGIGALGAYLELAPKPLANQSFRTAVGQQATVTLPDGSQVTLNTDTLVHTVSDDGRRLVYLDKGQAFFKVAKDRRHPFIVTAAGRTVTAVGTAFDVRIDKGELKVVLVEGKVRVQAAAPSRAQGAPAATDSVLPSRVTEMSPGSQLVATSDADWKLTPTDVSRETSWLKGQLVIDDEPLGDVVDEVNRYSTRKIVIADADLAKRHVSGNFAPGDVHGFAMILQAAHVAELKEQPNGEILIIAEK